MTRTEFLKICETQYNECIAEMAAKGGDYAEEADVHANFRDDANEAEVPIEKALGFHLNKQYRAVRRYCNGHELKSEGIRSRITDTINYLLLLRGLVEYLEAE